MEMHIDMEQAAKIKVFGVGGGGGNAVQNMINSQLQGVSFICANTDAQALSRSSAEHKIQLGKDGLGAGARPERGQAAAEESLDAIREAIGDADMVFVTAGMGGGTGTGAAPVIARVAREKGVLTVGVVTKPFQNEGDKRMKHAVNGIAALRGHVDSLIIIPNDRLLAISPKNAKVSEMLKKADGVLYAAVRGVTDLITKPGLINADFADVRTVMSEQGMALMGEGIASGENRAQEAAKRAITSPLLEDVTIGGAKAMLVNITASEDLTMDEFNVATSCIREAAKGPNGEDPEIVLAMAIDENCGEEIRITVIATGIEPISGPHAPITQTQGGATIIDMNRKRHPSDHGGHWENHLDNHSNNRPSNHINSLADSQLTRYSGLGHIPHEVKPKAVNGYSHDDEDLNTPAYLRKQEHMRQAVGTHTPGADEFIFSSDESDVPSFIRRQRD